MYILRNGKNLNYKWGSWFMFNFFSYKRDLRYNTILKYKMSIYKIRSYNILFFNYYNIPLKEHKFWEHATKNVVALN